TLRLENRSANIVELAGGNEQTIAIHQADVQTGGIYDTTRTLTAKQVGAFDIVATLFGIPGVALHLKAQSEKQPKPTPTPEPHVKDVSYPPAGHTVQDHVKGVSWGPPGAGPHVKGVTWGVPGSGDHEKGKTWPKDTGGSV